MLRHIIFALSLAVPASAEPATVVTDIAPIQSLVAMVSGEAPTVLVDPGADPHDFQFRPSQIRAIANADILFMANPGLMPWLAEEAHGINSKLVVAPIDISDELHPWLDPLAAAGWLDGIAVRLGEHDPDSAANYRARAQSAADEISKLHSEMAETLAPLQGLHLLASHDAFGALASRYGLEFVGSVADEHDHSPGAGHLSDLSELIEHGEVDCLITEEGEAHEFADLLGAGHNLAVVIVDPLGHSIAAGQDQYPNLMRALAASLAACAG